MSSTKISALLGFLALVSKASAHGVVQGIVVDGVYQPNYDPDITQYQNPIPLRPGWSIPGDTDTGFISDFTSPDIICHLAATPGGTYVTIAAGDTIDLQWTPWPESHKGPMIDYLASCNGDCTTVDKTSLLFNKIDEAGLINGSPAPGTWASDTLIANNNTWSVKIPSSIAPGKYVLRHETIALHSADKEGGAQAYPQCINLDITGSGTNSLTGGTLGTSLYTETDPGIFVNIYYPALTNYTIPGPALIADATSGTQPSGSASATPSSSASPTASAASSSSAYPTAWETPSSSASPTSSETPSSSASPTASAAPTSSAYPTAWETPSSSASPTAPVSSSIAMASPTSSAWSYAPLPTDAPFSKPASSSATGWSWSSWLPPVNQAPSSSSVDGAATSAASTSTSPVSFTSTVTGRIGRPTKFTCYADED